MKEIGKVLIILGSIALFLGIYLFLGGKLSFLGRLPGDILIEKENYRFYFPLASGLLVSIILTIVINLFLYLFRK
ncbi:MAG: hypothetical protein DDT40_00626 [candidate division WS2 bacterium]|uniref:DUF2905 domain-containing protein n=1 Tax=Psychracetigena formicireducens TaxID=2986056 RepID=A0A9E2BM45_PSYF1|nr:hypothetical protein [Candidatus Psychracetigena formicireducens]MBT9145509.1 hypothetical protein [Candidatus Psychracetigena formicireducens]MBT9150454.1 hypothetical protein [Candidatus Psychracetigena formicireducens]